MSSSGRGRIPPGTSDGADNQLRVVFLVGKDNVSTRLSIDTVCRVHGVFPVAVFGDTAKSTLRIRLRSLRRNIRREGISYIYFRAVSAVREVLDYWAGSIVPRAPLESFLPKAVP